jgi:hypothetical protein
MDGAGQRSLENSTIRSREKKPLSLEESDSVIYSKSLLDEDKREIFVGQDEDFADVMMLSRNVCDFVRIPTCCTAVDRILGGIRPIERGVQIGHWNSWHFWLLPGSALVLVSPSNVHNIDDKPPATTTMPFPSPFTAVRFHFQLGSLCLSRYLDGVCALYRHAEVNNLASSVNGAVRISPLVALLPYRDHLLASK